MKHPPAAEPRVGPAGSEILYMYIGIAHPNLVREIRFNSFARISEFVLNLRHLSAIIDRISHPFAIERRIDYDAPNSSSRSCGLQSC